MSVLFLDPVFINRFQVRAFDIFQLPALRLFNPVRSGTVPSIQGHNNSNSHLFRHQLQIIQQKITSFTMLRRIASRSSKFAYSHSQTRPFFLQRPPLPTSTQQQIRHHGDGPGPDAPTIQLTFINADDSQTTVAARIGETLLQTAHRTGIEIEGACEGVCACSTCHVILDQELYDNLLDEAEGGHLGEDEEDMLDMAFGLTHTSRLGCQIHVSEVMDGSVITLPKATRNFYVDGHKPKPH